MKASCVIFRKKTYLVSVKAKPHFQAHLSTGLRTVGPHHIKCCVGVDVRLGLKDGRGQQRWGSPWMGGYVHSGVNHISVASTLAAVISGVYSNSTI